MCIRDRSTTTNSSPTHGHNQQAQGHAVKSRSAPLSEVNKVDRQHDLEQRSIWEQQIYRDHQAYLAARSNALPTTSASTCSTATHSSGSTFLVASPSSLPHRVLTTAKPPLTSPRPTVTQSLSTPVVSPIRSTSLPQLQPNTQQSAAGEPLAHVSTPAIQFPLKTRKAKPRPARLTRDN